MRPHAYIFMHNVSGEDGEVFLPQTFGDLDHDLCLHWGLYRSDYSRWVVPDAWSVPDGTTFVTINKQEFMKTPLQQGPAGFQYPGISICFKPSTFTSYICTKHSQCSLGQDSFG